MGSSPKDRLYPKQVEFVREYLVDANGKRAAIRAGYSARTAEVTASQLLRVPKVKAAIEAGQKAKQVACNVTAQSLIEDAKRIQAMCINSDRPDYANALKAMDLQAKLLGLGKVQVEHSGEMGVEHSGSIAHIMDFNGLQESLADEHTEADGE